MKQVHLSCSQASARGSDPTTVSVAGRFNSPINMGPWTVDEDHGGHPCAASGTFSNLVVYALTPPLGGSSLSFTFRVNGAPTSLACSIGTGSDTGQDLSNSVHVNAGDIISLHMSGTSTPAMTQVQVAIDFDSDNTGESVYGGSTPETVGDTRTVPALWPHGNRPQWGGTGFMTSLVGVPGAVTAIYVSLDVAAGSGGSGWRFNLLKNGVLQDGSSGTVDTSVSIVGASTTGNATFSLPCVAGDRLQLRAAYAGGNTMSPAFGVRYTATTDGQSNMGGNPSQQAPDDATRYNHAFGGVHHPAGGPNPPSWNETESLRQVRAGVTPFTLDGLIVRIQSSASHDWTLTLRRDEADSDLAATVAAGSVVGSTSSIIAIGAGETLGMEAFAAGAGADRAIAWVAGHRDADPPPEGSTAW